MRAPWTRRLDRGAETRWGEGLLSTPPRGGAGRSGGLSYGEARDAAAQRAVRHEADRARRAKAAATAAATALREAQRHVEAAVRVQRSVDGSDWDEEQQIRVEHAVETARRSGERARQAAQRASSAAHHAAVREAEAHRDAAVRAAGEAKTAAAAARAGAHQ